MKFQNLAGQSVVLSLPGFERGPGRKWLVVVGDVNDGTRRWRFEEPCMTRRDASRLADWFDKVADRRTKRHEIDFLEPNLSFEVVRDEGLCVVMTVAFELEARPPWNDRAVSERRVAIGGARVRSAARRPSRSRQGPTRATDLSGSMRRPVLVICLRGRHERSLARHRRGNAASAATGSRSAGALETQILVRCARRCAGDWTTLGPCRPDEQMTRSQSRGAQACPIGR
jgi:hypothetical protein